MKLSLFFFALSCCCLYAWAQEGVDTVSRKGTIVEGNMERYVDYFLIKSGISNKSLNFSLTPRENGVTQFLQPIWYRPAVENTLSVGVSFKRFGLGVGFKLAQNDLVQDRQGVSEYFDVQLNSYGREVGYDIYYQDYEGYFIANFDNFFDDLFNGEPLQRRDDMRLRNMGFNVYYLFSPEQFSFRAGFIHDEVQRKKGGSFALTGSFSYVEATADSSFVPPDTDINFNPDAFYSDVEFYALSISPGYAYTFVFKKGYYASLGVSGMIGAHLYDAQGENLADDGLHYFLKGIARASIGYNGPKWVFGINGLADIQGFNTQFIQYRTENLAVSLFVGRRLYTRWLAGRESLISLKKKK